MSGSRDVSGMAALSICESLLLCLSDRSLLKEADVIGILQDVASAHRAASSNEADATMHQAVADLIEAIISGGNSVRHRKDEGCEEH